MQLITAAVAHGATLALAAGAAPARADGELMLRGVYYKERSTRVVQPMLDGRFDVGDAGSLDAHVLVDAITSASAAAGAPVDSEFDEQRYEIGGGYLHQLTDLRVGGQLRVSYEPDYTSLFGGLRSELELADKNTVVGVGASFGHDWINDSALPEMSQRVDDTLRTYLGSLSLSQLLSSDAVASVTYDVSYLDGLQANPYRTRFTTANQLLEETHPRTRLRHALAGSGRLFVPASRTTAIGSYRFYIDDWGIRGHTPELRVIQELGPLEVGVRYRLHTQNGADFYRDVYPMLEVGDLITDDEKLSPFTSHTIGGRLATELGTLGFGGTLAAARAELIVEYVDQNNRFGNAGVAHVALTVPFAY
jgi:hypothetical protein